jgi:hypothetical protein
LLGQGPADAAGCSGDDGDVIREGHGSFDCAGAATQGGRRCADYDEVQRQPQPRVGTEDEAKQAVCSRRL